MISWQIVLLSAIAYSFVFLILKLIFDFIFRGFSPFVSSRPWVIDILLKEVREKIKKEDPYIVSLGSGKSGFLHALGKAYKKSTRIGLADTLSKFLIGKLQLKSRRSGINLLYDKIHRIDVSNADLVYCHLDMPLLRELAKKFKFECKPGTMIISNGYIIPNMKPVKEIALSSKKSRLASIADSGEILMSRGKKSKKENKIYIYEI